MISASFNDSDVRVRLFLNSRRQVIFAGIEKQQNWISVDLQNYVKENKLSGQVLRNRTGNLRRAVVRRVEKEQGVSVTAIVGIAPNASKYARAHEFGADIQIPAVSGKLMVFTDPRSGQKVFTMRHRAFTVKMPERSFLRSALKEKRASYITRLAVTVKGLTE